MKINTCFSQKPLGHFNQIFIKANKINKYDACHMIKIPSIPIYDVKNSLKIVFLGTRWTITTKLGMKHWRLKPIISYSNDNPGLTLTYFTARSATWAFIWANMTMMYSLEIIASCDLEFGLYTKPNGYT